MHSLHSGKLWKVQVGILQDDEKVEMGQGLEGSMGPASTWNQGTRYARLGHGDVRCSSNTVRVRNRELRVLG